jgi:hypothetical protein
VHTNPPLEWIADDEFVIDGVAFRCFGLMERGVKSEPDRFCIIKPRWQIERYEELIRRDTPKNIFELGIWAGGSTAFLAQLARPRKLVAVELASNPCTPLETFIDAGGLRTSIATYYGVDQADSSRLRSILDREYPGEPLDLVVDDASHQVAQTRASFNALFPRLAPGGTYLIEDWSWAHTGGAALPEVWSKRTPLSVLIFELMLVCAHHPEMIDGIVVKKGSAFVRRGPATIEAASFDVAVNYGPIGRDLMTRLTGGE